MTAHSIINLAALHSNGLPIPETLHELLRHDPKTGSLYWRNRELKWFVDGAQTAQRRCRIWNGKFSGKEAFTALTPYGYRHGRIFNVGYLLHRVLWAMETGNWPSEHIDHINGDRADNRMVNLREVSNAENHLNMRMPSNNTSGSIGVNWNKNARKWQAHIRSDGIKKHLGYFVDFDQAVAVRSQAEVDHGYHANHGRKS